MQLLPCDDPAKDHPYVEDPSLLEAPMVEDLMAPDPAHFGVTTVGDGPYCQAHQIFSSHDALGETIMVSGQTEERLVDAGIGLPGAVLPDVQVVEVDGPLVSPDGELLDGRLTLVRTPSLSNRQLERLDDDELAWALMVGLAGTATARLELARD